MQSTTAAAFVLLVCVAGTAAALPAAEPQQPLQPQQTQQVQNPNATLVFTDQTSNGTTVRVNTATLSQGGFVAVHDTSLANNSTVSSVVGVSQRLGPGPHQDVVVRLYSLDGREFDRSELRNNTTLTAMAHFDSNDNDEFDFVATNGSADGPYIEGTQAVVESADIAVSADESSTSDGFLGGIGPLAVVVAVGVVAVLVVVGFVAVRRRR